ncbi:MAG TPA: PKD-like domain-containing protein, partial [Ohtaekwangia sp.]|uniref:PKD-like domain-containing protein n=1 Tax=Ohtaekwangia sp. TaxID=2066019 RepID=UPI002F95F8A9
MKRLYIKIFFIGLLACNLTSFGQTSTQTGCDIRHSGGNCVGQPITFYPDNCSAEFTNYLWIIDGVQVSTQQSFAYTFTTAGSHTVKLGTSCGTTTGCNYPKPVYTQTSVFLEAVPRPPITASTKQLCETGSVTLSVDAEYTNSGYDFIWRSVPAGYTATGTSVTFNNVSTTTTFRLTISGEACTNENQVTVEVSKTTLQPALGTGSFYHRQTLTASGGGIWAGHYWQQARTATDVNHPVNGNYIVYESGDYYTRFYSPAINCWASALGPVHVTIDCAPPLAVAGQILKPGYNEVYFANDEKDYIFSYADYYWVNGAGDNPSIVRPYCVNGVITGNKLYKNGTYYLKGRDRGTNTWGPTLTLAVTLRGDESLNWIHSRAYDGTTETINGQATDKVVSESKSYFGDDGKNLQSQTKSFTTGKIMTSQALHDQYDRTVGSTLPAPITSADFSYNAAFVLAPSGDVYDHNDFDNTSPGSVNTVYNPVEVNDTEEGTVGWYYSANNTLETNVPKTKYPYSRVDFYNDGTGEARRSSGVGEVLRFGTGHESLSGTFPVYQELQDYLSKRTIALPGITQDGVLFNEGVQTVARDQNGKYAVSITDKAGHVVLAARAGKDTYKVLSISNTVVSSGSPASANYRAMTYFYILQAQAVSITGSSDFVVEDIVSEVRKDPGQTFAGSDGKWPAGFYRILLTNESSEITLSYKNYFLDVSYSFYNDMGRLVSSVSPNGMKEWESVTTNLDTKYAAIDKTTYQYNFRGWLMSVTEPDAGTTNYKYRSDGKIRFSQNAQQSIDKHFSYTHYDQLGRPVESGEYTGTQYTFALLNNQLEYSQQTRFLSSDTRDWVVTHYDFADGNFNDATGLGSIYAQDFVDGAVSWSENANIKTWYSYDELGRVTWMAQKPATLKRVFVVKYTYDFLGNVLTAANLSYDLKGVLLEQFY